MPYTFNNVMSNHTIQAVFALETVTMNVSVSPSGTGSMSSSSGTYNYGDKIYVVGGNAIQCGGDEGYYICTPNTGYEVDHWEANNTTIDSSGYTMTGNTTVVCVLRKATYNITASIRAQGASTDQPELGTITPISPQSVEYGSSVTYACTPISGLKVYAVQVDDGTLTPQSSGSYTLTDVTAAHNIRFWVNSDMKTVTLTVRPIPSQSYEGTRAGYINIGTSGEQTHVFTQVPSSMVLGIVSQSASMGVLEDLEGGSGQIQCKPETAYEFYRFEDSEGNALANGATLTDGMIIVAKFKLKTFTITPSVNDPDFGTVTPDTVQTVDYGGNMTFSATPAEHYKLSYWLVDGQRKGTSGSMVYTFTDVTGNHTIQAVFEDAGAYKTIILYKGVNYDESDPRWVIDGVHLKGKTSDSTTVPGMTFRNKS